MSHVILMSASTFLGRRPWVVMAAPESERGGVETRRTTKVFVVEDHVLVREGICQIIDQDPDLRVTGQAGTFDEAVAGIQSVNPDVILIDISLAGRKDQSGIDLIEHLRTTGSRAKMIVVTGHSTSYYANSALKRGAHGFVTKDEVFTQLLPAIRMVIGGGTYVSTTRF